MICFIYFDNVVFKYFTYYNFNYFHSVQVFFNVWLNVDAVPENENFREYVIDLNKIFQG